MKVLALTLGPLATNCYLVWREPEVGGSDRSPAIALDPADDPDGILRAAEQHSLAIRLIANTHGHGDHIGGVSALRAATGAAVAIHESDAAMLSDAMLSGAAVFGLPQETTAADRLLKEGDSLALDGGLSLAVLHTPGHTPGSICLLGESVLFSGDCLFAGGIGRTDLPGGDEEAMMASLARLRALDPRTKVYPGHGPPTTIGEEVASNPWLADL